MAPFGPRLDRPSAVGDEGRPRATSLGLAALVVLGVAVAVGFAQGDPGYFMGFALLAGLLVAGMALLDRDRIRQIVVGHLCFLPAASILTVVAVLSPGHPLLVGGVVAALLGVAGAWADVADGDHVRTTLVSSITSYAFGLVGLVAGGFVLVAALVAGELFTGLTAGSGSAGSVLGLSILVGVVCTALRVALWALPVVELAPRERVESVQRRLDGAKLALERGFVASLGFAFFATVLALGGILGPLASLQPFREILGVLTSVVVVAPLFGVAALAVAVTLLAIGARKATTEYSYVTARALAAALGAAGYLVVLALIAASTGFLFGVQLVVLLLAAVLLPIAMYAALVVAFIALRLGVVTDRAAPLTLAAIGLVAMGIEAAMAGLPAVVVFAAVAGALVVWDVGTFGLGVTAELGHIPETRRLELYHGVFAVGVGLAALAFVTVIDFVRGSVGTGIGASQAMAIAVVGVVLLLLPLRG